MRLLQGLGASAILTPLALTLLLPFAVAAPDCLPATPNGPLQITPDCTDPLYSTPLLTSSTDEPSPIPHRKISGSFNGTTVDFTIYLPSRTQHPHPTRFFQLVYPLQNSTAAYSTIAFGAASGAYTVTVSGTLGYRADAAVAKFSKRLAREYYGIADTSAIYGYIYGGSGGSFQTVGAMENTAGVWDGGIALIQAVPVSNPNNWAVRALAGLVLDRKAEGVRDAVAPGGSGDPFKGLEEVERGVLEEATALGVPLAAWEDFDAVARNRTGLWGTLREMVVPTVRQAVPGFADDFWSTKGYLGTEESGLGDVFRGLLVEFNATVEEVRVGEEGGVPVGITLDYVPEDSPADLEFTVLRGGEELGLFTGLVDKDDRTVYIYGDNNATVLATLEPGIQLQADNRWYLAVHSLHRHQVPPLEDGYYGYDYLRNDAGEPLYPQLDVFLAPSISEGASGGGRHTGNITGKLFVLDNLADFDAFPWHADWYKSRVKGALRDRFEDNYRLYYNEHADHYMGSVEPALQTRLVDFTGLNEQLLRDLAVWVEGDVSPPQETRYQVQNGQVVVPLSASDRGGIQPIVELTVGGENRTEVSTGEAVTFALRTEVPPGTGKVVSIEWDFNGTGEFVEAEFGKASVTVETEVPHVYDAAGTYFAAVRVASQRDGDASTPFARALNLGRVRVVVN
ncbi:hypothetical protein BJY04DRAFT_225832 [Aspergillus karnatakaensis]|uniref:uncharacterized protein n=1 Tax=Aspergillus karnatakaensis TaxID=1810916 RepID=UPI003CCDA9ED